MSKIEVPEMLSTMYYSGTVANLNELMQYALKREGNIPAWLTDWKTIAQEFYKQKGLEAKINRIEPEGRPYMNAINTIIEQ